MSIDQRGFVHIAQAEAAEFLQPQQVIYNETVNLIEYGEDSVTVHTTGGMTITADHVLCTFSVGVLQNTDVAFQPPLPDWKIEAINSIEMVSRVLDLDLDLDLDTYCALGYLHKDFPSVQRDFLVPHGGKPLPRCNDISYPRRIRWDCMQRSKEEGIPSGRAWITLDSSPVLT